MTLDHLYRTFASHPEGRWIMKPENAHELYRFVKEHPIKKVLDLGTGIGCTASIVSLALKNKGETDYRIESLEQYDKCVNLANSLIPGELKQDVIIHKSEVKVWQTDMIPYQVFSVYETVPEGDYDLILNDGPAPFEEKGHFVELNNATITKMLLEDRLKPGTLIAWDGRMQALRTLERYFGENFYLVHASKTSNFNVIERKDNTVKFLDTNMEEMKMLGYFS